MFVSAGSSLEKSLRFEVAGQQVGWIRPHVASVLRRYPDVFCTVGGAVELCPTLDSYERRTQAVDAVLQTLTEEAEFTCLKGWRNEVSVGNFYFFSVTKSLSGDIFFVISDITKSIIISII